MNGGLVGRSRRVFLAASFGEAVPDMLTAAERLFGSIDAQRDVMSITRRSSRTEIRGGRVPRSTKVHRAIGFFRAWDENIGRVSMNRRRSGSPDSFSLHGGATKAILVAVS